MHLKLHFSHNATNSKMRRKERGNEVQIETGGVKEETKKKIARLHR